MARISQQQLESYVWGAATLLRGTIDAGDYKQFIFPLLFYKRRCDVFDPGGKALGTTAQALKAQAESENVQQRLAEPEELGPMAALIASEAGGKAITGQVISVDGGYRV